MPYPRSKLIVPSQTPFYHIISRCVRRTYLCGFDKETGQSYEHRKDWVENRLILLSRVFCIKICSYAIMSNHTHLVLKIDAKAASKLNNLEVIKRWLRISRGTEIVREYLKNEECPTNKTSQNELIQQIQTYRDRLTSISWFMKLLNEYIARKANKEDECTGHFWEGRFKSQALLDFRAVLTCMLYVDLNPIRAGFARSIHDSFYTSMIHRVAHMENKKQPKHLLPLKMSDSEPCEIGLKYSDYLDLLNDAIRKINNKGASYKLSRVVNKYSVNSCPSDSALDDIEKLYTVAIGSAQKLSSFAEATGRAKMKGAINSAKISKRAGNKLH